MLSVDAVQIAWENDERSAFLGYKITAAYTRPMRPIIVDHNLRKIDCFEKKNIHNIYGYRMNTLTHSDRKLIFPGSMLLMHSYGFVLKEYRHKIRHGEMCKILMNDEMEWSECGLMVYSMAVFVFVLD